MFKWTRLARACRNRAFYGTLLFPFILPVYRAVLVNRTLDSNAGDPVTGFLPIYQPQGWWVDQTCTSPPSGFCFQAIQPDVTRAFHRTWMNTYYIPGQNVNFTLRFTGVAVWVFFIIAGGNNEGDPATYTQVNITLDGKHAGNYSNTAKNLPRVDVVYNATIFSKSGLANTSHELVIGTNDYVTNSYINFDWAIYTVDAPASQSASSAFTATTDSASITSTSSPTTALQHSSSKIGIIVGGTLGGLAVIVLVLVFLIRRSYRAPPVQNGKAEGILDIDVPLGLPHQPFYEREIPVPHLQPFYKREIPVPHLQPFYEREIPVPDHEPMQSKAARLREARQRELDERIHSAQHELDNLRLLRNARSAGENGDPSAAGPSRPSPDLALLHNEMQQLRNRVDYFQAQRESNWGLGLSDETDPPAYTQPSNNVQ